MRISFGFYDVEFSSHSSRQELEKSLQATGQNFEVIETTKEHARSFYSLKFRPEVGTPESHPRSTGVCSALTGIAPQLLVDASAGALYLGVDSSVFIFNAEGAPTKRLELDSPFYCMSHFTALNRTLVVHEIGLLWLDSEGQIVWRHDTDIISTVALVGPHTLEVRLWEGGRTIVDLSSGSSRKVDQAARQ